jgi:hypothetical protein
MFIYFIVTKEGRTIWLTANRGSHRTDSASSERKLYTPLSAETTDVWYNSVKQTTEKRKKGRGAEDRGREEDDRS